MSPVRYRYQTAEIGKYDIHYRTLRNRRQFADEHGEAQAVGISSATWPIFGVVWPSGDILARLMASYEIGDKRILEMGCGIGLASLVLNERMADITATDIHPCAGDFLQHNTQLNNGRHIPFFRTDWTDNHIPCCGVYDLLIGSDLLYEEGHPKALSYFIKKYAKPRSEVIIAEAGRGFGSAFKFKMKALGFHVAKWENMAADTERKLLKGKILHFRR